MIRIVEVGPRDCLQNEPAVIPLEDKVRYVDLLSESGLTEIETGSFVSPEWVPQMAGSDDLFWNIHRKPGVTYSALVPNEKGMERALRAKVDKIAVFTAASETFNRRNVNATIAESIERFKPVVRQAQDAGLPVRGYISTVFYCPYEGRMTPDAALPVVQQLLDLGVNEVALSDTVGRARPDDVRRALEAVLPICPKEKIALHFHNTYGNAVADVIVAWREFDIVTFDSSAGGLGGCPYARGATGNIATEDIVAAFQARGADLPIDLSKVREAVHSIRKYTTS